MPDDYYSLWIIDRKAGFCVFEQQFETMPGDMASDLISGFFSALFIFSKEIVHSDVDSINFKNDIRITFHGSDQLLFSVATSTAVRKQDARGFLQRIEGRFNDAYRDVLEKDTLNNTSLFEDFARVVEAELGVKSTSVGFLESKAIDFVQRYEHAKTDLKKFQEKLLHQTKSFGTPLLNLVKDQVTFSRYKIDEIARFTKKHLNGPKKD